MGVIVGFLLGVWVKWQQNQVTGRGRVGGYLLLSRVEVCLLVCVTQQMGA